MPSATATVPSFIVGAVLLSTIIALVPVKLARSTTPSSSVSIITAQLFVSARAVTSTESVNSSPFQIFSPLINPASVILYSVSPTLKDSSLAISEMVTALPAFSSSPPNTTLTLPAVTEISCSPSAEPVADVLPSASSTIVPATTLVSSVTP